MSSGKYPFTIEQDVDSPVVLTYTDSAGTIIDLSSYSAIMEARDSIDTSSVIFTLHSNSGDITLSASGTITFPGLDAATTLAMEFNPSPYYLKILDVTGFKTRLVEGTVMLSKEKP